MRKIAVIILFIVLVGYIAGNISFADTNEFDTKVQEFSDEFSIRSTSTPTREIESTFTPDVTAKPTMKPTSTLSIELKIESIITIKPSDEPTIEPTIKLTAIPTANPTVEITTAPNPTTLPNYTIISDSIRSGALQGINEGRAEEGNKPISLDSGLNAKAEAHAIEMTKADSLFHSSMGYVESVRSGANIGGWAEGYGASCHATQLAMDESIMKIGVGSVMSANGTVYTCIIGDR